MQSSFCGIKTLIENGKIPCRNKEMYPKQILERESGFSNLPFMHHMKSYEWEGWWFSTGWIILWTSVVILFTVTSCDLNTSLISE